jgi:hypothetical protein
LVFVAVCDIDVCVLFVVGSTVAVSVVGCTLLIVVGCALLIVVGCALLIVVGCALVVCVVLAGLEDWLQMPALQSG